MAIYGNYNLWSWLRYWYIDTKDFTDMLLADAAYYDYDFSQQAIDDKRRRERMRSRQALEIWSDEKVAALLGTAVNPLTGRGVFAQGLDAEQAQRLVRAEMGLDKED